MWQAQFKLGAALAAGIALAGCMSEDGSLVSQFSGKPTDATRKLPDGQVTSENSLIIEDLQSRQSILGQSSSYTRISKSVIAANSRTAEAELRMARLRAEAMSKNWLPSIGPVISLSSLGDLVANLVIEQVLFDHGRKKAERDFAKADVEVAAVALAEDTNSRVHEALTLYLAARESQEAMALSSEALKDMKHFRWIMSERVKGGVSDMSDLNVLGQKLAEIQSDISRHQEKSQTAMAELNAMSVDNLDNVTGIAQIQFASPVHKSLEVLRSEAERERDIAAAKVERAGLLPGLVLSGSSGSSGDKYGVNVKSDQLFNLGTGANLKAIEAKKDLADRKVAKAKESTTRKLRSLEQRLNSVRRQTVEARALAERAKRNLDLFQEQYDLGQRQVMDVVGVYETFARQLSMQNEYKYEAARIEIQIAQMLGILADGSDI